VTISVYDRKSNMSVINSGNLTSYPPAVSVNTTKLGYNMQSTFPDLNGLAAALAGGATIVRWQPGWSSVESYSSPGTYSLGTATETALAYCGTNGIVPIAVCGYGPPYKNVLTLTVAGGSTIPIGSYTIPVVETVSSISTPLDHVYLTGGTQIVATAKWGYYGAPGSTLTVNRLLYASPADQLLTNPSLIAYFNYLEYVASRIAANGATGYVSIWNEPPWAHDPWDARGKFYDTVPGSMNSDTRMKMFLQYGLGINTLPSGVRIINGATDKTGSSGIIEQGLSPTSGEVSATIALESIHPYGNLPETSMWDQGKPSGGSYTLLNPTVDATSNFTNLARAEDLAAVGLGRIATETGVQISDDYHQAVWLLRRTVVSWACSVLPVIFALAEGVGDTFNVVAPVTYAPRQSYAALARLMTLIGTLGGAGGSSANLPTLISYNGPTWPLMVVGVYGASGSALFLWQRTGYNSATTWTTWGAPATANVYLQMPSGTHSLVSATDLVSGNSVAATLSSGVLSVPNVGESVIAVALNP
jgi:hypothetical protein